MKPSGVTSLSLSLYYKWTLRIYFTNCRTNTHWTSNYPIFPGHKSCGSHRKVTYFKRFDQLLQENRREIVRNNIKLCVQNAVYPIYFGVGILTLRLQGLRFNTWDSLFQMCTFPLYKLASIHGSEGWRSTHFTRSERADSFRFISSLKGWNEEIIQEIVLIRNGKNILHQWQMVTSTWTKMGADLHFWWCTNVNIFLLMLDLLTLHKNDCTVLMQYDVMAITMSTSGYFYLCNCLCHEQLWTM